MEFTDRTDIERAAPGLRNADEMEYVERRKPARKDRG